MKTIHPIKLVLALSILSGMGTCTFAKEPDFDREPIEWYDIWLPHANETDLPRVLLIGDSIARDYNPEVERLLAEKAYVNRLASSAFISDPMLLDQIKLVLDHYSFDVIVFNNGMHGWQHGETEYRAAFPVFLETIQNNAHGAKLVWADTTPLKDSTKLSAKPVSSSIAAADSGKTLLKADRTAISDERIAARNAIAHDFLKRRGILIVDLHAPMLGHPEYYADNIHFNPTGIAIQAELIANEVSTLLTGR